MSYLQQGFRIDRKSESSLPTLPAMVRVCIPTYTRSFAALSVACSELVGYIVFWEPLNFVYFSLIVSTQGCGGGKAGCQSEQAATDPSQKKRRER